MVQEQRVGTHLHIHQLGHLESIAHAAGSEEMSGFHIEEGIPALENFVLGTIEAVETVARSDGIDEIRDVVLLLEFGIEFVHILGDIGHVLGRGGNIEHHVGQLTARILAEHVFVLVVIFLVVDPA